MRVRDSGRAWLLLATVMVGTTDHCPLSSGQLMGLWDRVDDALTTPFDVSD